MTTRPRPLKHLLSPAPGCLLLGLLTLACTGSSTPREAAASVPEAPATRLAYRDPAGDGYRLVRNPASLGSRLVLDLVGPTGARIQGCTLSLSLDGSQAGWGHPEGSQALVREGRALTLGAGPKLLKSQAKGRTLEAAIYQKGAAPATLGPEPLLTVALELQPGQPKGPVSLSTEGLRILDAEGILLAVPLSLGALDAQ